MIPSVLPAALPVDVTLLDVFALAWFVGMWAAFEGIQARLPKGGAAINRHLVVVRRRWMARMLERENRIMDSTLVGHTMNSCTFFASTTVLILAGLLGSFGAVEAAHGIIGALSFTAPTSMAFFELKMLLLVVIFAYAFLRFTWALRQFNYCIALIGAAPMPPVAPVTRDAMAETIGSALTLAAQAFNGGLRSYYFALAALCWMINPWLFMAASAGVVAMLLRRQAWSRMARLIRRQAEALEADEADGP